MTRNQRIFLNFLATYGRSLFSLVCGLFTGRWVLMALGEVDYGLYGLVGGMTCFIGFLNSLMATSVGRFFAYSVGVANKQKGNGLLLCRQWFTTAVAIHTILPIVLVLIGYPVGVYAVERWLTIPVERITGCVWVWRFVCVSCLAGMVNVPFTAMYTAKQEIAELTIFSVCQTATNVVLLYFMVTHPGDWLVRYAGCACAVGVLPQILICIRAFCRFPECRVRIQYWGGWGRVRELSVFATYRFFGGVATLISRQGLPILVNKFLGPAKNAAMAVGGTVAGQSTTFAEALAGAISPAIANAYGEGDFDRMRSLSYYACKCAGAMALMFVLPMILEVKELMVLWLENPPAESAELCVALMIIVILENISCGHYMAIFAVGRIRGYQMGVSLSSLLALAFVWLGLWASPKLVIAGLGLICSNLLIVLFRLYFGRTVARLSVRYWLLRIACPEVLCAVVAFAIGELVVLKFDPSFFRVVGTALAVETVFLPMVFFCVFSATERRWIVERIMKVIQKK